MLDIAVLDAEWMAGDVLAEILDPPPPILLALSPDDPCRIVSLAKSAQLGGTVLANKCSRCSLSIKGPIKCTAAP